MKLFDYDKLSKEKKLEIANLIKQDNLQTHFIPVLEKD